MDRFTLGAMLSPFLISFIVFMVIPVIASIILSFFRFDMLGTPEFTGFDNYFRMIMTITDNEFIRCCIKTEGKPEDYRSAIVLFNCEQVELERNQHKEQTGTLMIKR